MFIPLGHDRQVLRRMPVMTIGLVSLNVLLFFFINIPGISHEREYDQALTELRAFIRNYPWVALEADCQQRLERLSAEYLKSLDQAIESGEVKVITKVLEERQLINAELHRLSAQFVKADDALWINNYGFRPYEHKFNLWRYLTSIFMHGGLEHLLGNMIFLFIAGIAIEDSWGRRFYLGFYLLSGFIATATHLLFNLNSKVPLVGASGAIAGLLGAFLIRHHKAKLKVLLLVFMRVLKVPAFILLPLDLCFQLLSLWQKEVMQLSSGVAFDAHIGGYFCGIAVALILRFGKLEEKLTSNQIDKSMKFGLEKAVEEAQSHLLEGEVDEAIRKLKQRLQATPDDIAAMEVLAQAFAQSSQRDPEVAIRHRIISTHLRKNEADHALAAYSALLDSYPDQQPQHPLPPREWMMLCEYLIQCRMTREAAGEYEKLARAFPGQWYAAQAMLCAAELFIQPIYDPERARALLLQAAENPAINAALRTRIAESLQRLEQMDQQRTGRSFTAQGSS